MSPSGFVLVCFLFFASAFAARLPENRPPQSVPPTWFWGNVNGRSFLTRIQTERAPKFCRSSWVLSTVSALSDRLRISNPGAHPDPALSPQVVLNCVSRGSCAGGRPTDVLEYIHRVGVPDDTCQSYEGRVAGCNGRGICRDCTHGDEAIEDFLDGHCWAVENYPKYLLTDYGVLNGKQIRENGDFMVQKMQEEIFRRGPITCGVRLTQDLAEYTSGILTTTNDLSDTIHYVNVVGWDTKGDVRYWIGRNCWGEYWGDGGFFKIAMGDNVLGVERECYWGNPTAAASESSLNSQSDPAEEDRGLYRRPIDFVPRFSFSKPGRSKNQALPPTYDIRNLGGKNYATVNKNQHIPVYCGSCWAFSTTSALADRYALLYRDDDPLFDIATQVLIDCEPMSNGCRGGWPFYAYDYIVRHGLPHESCAPYQAVDQTCTPVNTCKICAEDGSCRPPSKAAYPQFGALIHGSVWGKEDIKEEIFMSGPISCAISITADFLAYSGGIFNDTTGAQSSDHAVEVAGWGEEDGIEYWIIRNSWGTYWGENGWARIAMGPGELGLSSVMCDWALPRPFEGTLPPRGMIESSPPKTPSIGRPLIETV